jgi:hypothetical protein
MPIFSELEPLPDSADSPAAAGEIARKVIVHLTTPFPSTGAPTERGFREIRQTHLTRHNSKIVRSVLNSARAH